MLEQISPSITLTFSYQVPAPFSWEVPPPFVMSPSEGVTAVGTSTTVTCSLRATDASVFVSRAVLTVGHGVNAIKPEPFLEMKVRHTKSCVTFTRVNEEVSHRCHD